MQNLKSIVRRAVEASFSIADFEEAIASEVEDLIDYRFIALEVLANYDLDEMVSRAAADYALDILEGV